MKPDFIYFKELLLGENNKFTLDFPDGEFVQEVDFLSKNECYITVLNCKLKVKEYIHDKAGKTKKLSEKSKLFLEKGPSYQIDLNYLFLEIIWYLKQMNYPYQFKLYPQIFDQYSYKYKFRDTAEKKLKIVKFILHFTNLLEKDSILKENL